ncbi:MAG: hypothetical protein ACRCUY_03810 [Thermoguttaceae bacterium]
MNISFSSTSYSSVRPTYVASTTSKAAGETATSNGSNNSDTLTLSEEGKQAANELQPKEKFYEPRLISGSPYQHHKEDLAHSKHPNVLAWMLGTSEEGTHDRVVLSATDRAVVRNQAMLEAKKLDSMVADKLKQNGIILGDKETLNFSINKSGEIKVDVKGISDDQKRASIEKALNGDQDFTTQLKYTHALREMTKIEPDAVSYRFILETHMQRELGLSLDEFRAPDDFSRRMTYKGENVDWIDQMYDEERLLYSNIVENADVTRVPEYELAFSFRNGIVIENGVSDLAGMNKRLDTGFRPNADITADLTLTLDGKGDYVNSSVTRLQILGEEIKDPAAFEQAHGRLVANATGANKGETYWNPFAGGVLQELAFDAKRLLTFEFGVDVETMNDVKIEIIGHVDKRQELRITGSKLGTGDLLGDGEESSNSGESSESGKDKKLALFSISSNHDAFAVQIQNVPNKADTEATDANADEPKPSELLLNIKMGTIFGNGIRQYSAKPEMTNFMQEVISSGIKMFRNQSPTITLFGKQ